MNMQSISSNKQAFTRFARNKPSFSTNKYPKISIITPSYNQALFIRKTIESILNQNYPNLEYIIIDGGSTDGTISILKKYGSKITWKSEKDKGQTNAINKGFKMATGDILAYINSDDVYEKGAFFKVADYFQKNPKIWWTDGKCKIINEDDKEIRQWITAYKNYFLKRYSYNMLLVLDYISPPAVFWRREVMDEFGLFDESQYYEMDYEYWLRIGKKYKQGFINDYLADFRIHTQSKTGQHFVRHYWQEFIVAKKYTQNPILLSLHLINFLSIISSYSFLSFLKNE